jgi:ribonuclease PH
MPKIKERGAQELRPLKLTPNWLHNAEGSCLIEAGNTRVISAASFTTGVPSFLRGKGTGWVTAEYGMLPRSTNERMQREAAKGKQTGRTVEIQRLIGRSLRQAVDMDKLGENTIAVDCDVLDADGGTRTSSITSGYVALHLALHDAYKRGILASVPIACQVAAISVGICNGKVVLDLDYEMDSAAGVDMNVVMTSEGKFVEVQGTGEHAAFSETELKKMLSYARSGIERIFELQRSALKKGGVKL